MLQNNTQLVHIYGFVVDFDEKIKIKAPAKLFKLPFYGSTENADEDDTEKMHYVGMEIGSEKNPFDYLCAKNGSFQMSEIEPSEDTINKMKKLYPKKDLKCHSFLKNVYTSHYYSGTVMVGYFFSLDGDYSLNQENAEDSDNYVDPCDMELTDIVNENTSDVELVNVSHTLKNGFGQYFLGKQLSQNFENFEFSHDEEPGHKFYSMCHESYNISDHDDLNLTFKEGFISSNKIIAFVPTMCHCCT